MNDFYEPLIVAKHYLGAFKVTQKVKIGPNLATLSSWRPLREPR